MKKLLVLILLMMGGGATLTGCSGNSATSSSLPLSPAVATASPTTVVAKIYLGTFNAGPTDISLRNLDGSVIATTTSNPGGVAFFHNLTVPRDFRAVARPQGTNVEFSAELRGFDPNNRQALINVPTTLASRYFQAHPGISLADAENFVRGQLNLPAILMLDIGIGESTNGFFSHIDFWQKAARNGGFEAYSQQLLGQAPPPGPPTALVPGGANAPPPGPPTAFVFQQSDLDTVIQGLGDIQLDAIANKARLQFASSLQLTPQSGLAQSRVNFEILGPSTLPGQLLLGIGTGVGGNLITATASGVFGWAANQMGMNYGTSGQLSEILATVDNVSQTVNSINASITDANVKAQLQSVQNQTVAVQTATNSLINQMQTVNSTTGISNQPFSPPTTYGGFVQAINTPDYASTATNIQRGLIGPSAALMGAQGVVMTQKLGIDTPTNFQSFPWRSNHLLDVVVRPYNYFALYQELLLNLYSETAHNYLLFADPVDGVNSILGNFQNAVAALKTERQQQPIYMTQWGPLVDFENGVMWRENMGYPATYEDAAADVKTISCQLILPDGSSVVYDDFRLPNNGECLSLQQRGAYNPTPAPSVPVNSDNGIGDTGRSTAGLPNLGFQNVAEYLTAENTITGSSNGSNGNLWMDYWDAKYTATGSSWTFGESSDTYEFRLNHSNSVSKENSSSDQNVYLCCRTFGTNALVNPYAQVSYSGSIPPGTSIPPAPSPSPFVGTTLTPGEIAQYGVCTNVSNLSLSPAATPSASPTPVPIPAGAQQLDATLSYQVNVGGSFTVGDGSTQTFTNPTSSYSGNVSTQPQPGSGPNLLRQLVSWGSSDSRVAAVSNLPGLDGLVIPFLTSPVNLTGSVLGAAGNLSVNTGTLSYTPSAPAQHTLQSLQISPRNQIYGFNTQSQPATGSYPYYCTGFYTDGTISKLASAVNWTVTPSNNTANAQIVVTSAGPALSLNQPSQTTVVPFNLTITATVNGTTDNTTIQIVPPVR